MKAVFFKCQIPLERQSIDASGNISFDVIRRDMQQGEVVDVSSCDDYFMEFSDGSIWWNPDRKLFNIVGIPQVQQSCCGGNSA